MTKNEKKNTTLGNLENDGIKIEITTPLCTRSQDSMCQLDYVAFAFYFILKTKNIDFKVLFQAFRLVHRTCPVNNQSDQRISNA